MLLPLGVTAQTLTSSVNTYSPYSMYGLGELSTPGTAAQRSMGGVGVAMFSNTSVNVLNPADYCGYNSPLYPHPITTHSTYDRSSTTATHTFVPALSLPFSAPRPRRASRPCWSLILSCNLMTSHASSRLSGGACCHLPSRGCYKAEITILNY